MILPARAEAHLRRVLKSYARYYNEMRTLWSRCRFHRSCDSGYWSASAISLSGIVRPSALAFAVVPRPGFGVR
jgi:hypothetical protein